MLHRSIGGEGWAMSSDTSAFGQFLQRYAGGAASPEDAWLTEVAEPGANPGALRMLHYAPEGLRPGAPLVVVLHGCAQSAAAYAYGAGWRDLADRHGFALLCPEQRAGNNPNRCFNWFQPVDIVRGSGEAHSIAEMIAAAAAMNASDARRVYVTGLSAGGAMACAMLAAYPEIFAGGALIAGLPYGAAANIQQALGAMLHGRNRAPEYWGDRVRAASTHGGPWPKLSIWHGDADHVVAHANAVALAAQWANVHGLEPEPAERMIDGRRTRSVWQANGAAVVELNTIAGLAHGAPIMVGGADGAGAPGPFLIEAEISSSFEALTFWGIAGAASKPPSPIRAPKPIPRAAKARDPVVRDEKPVQQPSDANAPGAKRKRLDIGAIIKKALTKAGLMRR